MLDQGNDRLETLVYQPMNIVRVLRKVEKEVVTSTSFGKVTGAYGLASWMDQETPLAARGSPGVDSAQEAIARTSRIEPNAIPVEGLVIFDHRINRAGLSVMA